MCRPDVRHCTCQLRADTTSLLEFCCLPAAKLTSKITYVNYVSFSERELAFTFAICYRPSVCLSSVTFVRPTQVVQIFGNISTALSTWAIRWQPLKISRRSSQGNPSAGEVKHKRGSYVKTVQFALSYSKMCLVFRNQKKYSRGTTPSPWNLGSNWPTASKKQWVLTCLPCSVSTVRASEKKFNYHIGSRTRASNEL